MGRLLPASVSTQILNKEIKPRFIIKIGGVDFSNYLIEHSLSASTEYGSQVGQFVLLNSDGRFTEGGTNGLSINDEVEFYETYEGANYDYKKFRGFIENRARQENSFVKNITISCLDYISVLKNTDVKLQLEADKVQVKNEQLSPSNLTDEGETMFAQIFNFANDAIVTKPEPILRIRDIGSSTDDTEYQGFEILADVGQVKFGSPLNTNNYAVICPSYYHYPRGLFIEDCIEEIIKAELGYSGDYLFGEASSDDVVSNHLRTSYVEEFGNDISGNPTSTLTPNYTAQVIYVYAELQSDYNPTQIVSTTTTEDFDFRVDTVMYLNDTTGFEEPGSGETYKEITVGGFVMRYTGIGSGNTLTGVSGSYYINAGNTVTYDTGIQVTSLTVDSTSGLPSSGTATISGDTFSWTSKDATHLYGIPTSGVDSLSSHKSTSFVKFDIDCVVGRLWYLPTNNITSTLTDNNFTIPSGSTIDYIDHKFGRILLDSPISTSSVLTCNVDYNYKTLSSTGVEINKIDFLERLTENRYEAIKDLMKFMAPNYILRTQGADKIYGGYMNQKFVQDYNLSLVSDLAYLEDSDIYTRVVMFGKNKNPRNILFNEGVDFITTGQSYKSLASNDELVYTSTEDGWHNFETYISRAGYITAEDFVPEVFINNIKVDNSPHQVIAQPVTIQKTTSTTTTQRKSGLKGTKVEQQTYYYYKVEFAHQSLYSSEPIYLYNSSGELVFTLPPDDSAVDYSRGIWNAPGSTSNSDIEDLSTASYSIFYADNQIKIDYDNVIIKIKESLIPDPDRVVVNADYEYVHTMTAVNGISKVYDGRWDTQAQTEFFSNPPSDYNYAILDLGQVYSVQAIDITAGFYKPDDVRKFDVNFRMTLWYSLDNITYYKISSDTTNFEMSGGSSVSFEGDSISSDGNLSVRYFRLTLDNVTKVDFKNGVWPVAITEISVYSDVILRSEAKLIPMTYVTNQLGWDLRDNIVASYSLDDNEATTVVTDDTENFNGVLLNANTADISTTGKVNNCFDFNGSNQRVSCGNLFTTTTEKFSIEAWVFCDSFNSSGNATGIFSNWNAWAPGAQKGYSIGTFSKISTDEIHWRFVHCDGSTYYSSQYDSLDSSDFNTKYAGRWLHLVCTFDSTTNSKKFYINNDLAFSAGSGNAMEPDTTHGTYIGYAGVNSGYFNGKIDNVRIYNKALNTIEIEALYNSGGGTSRTYTDTLLVESTNAFVEPGSGETVTAYIDDTPFTYTGLSSVSFTGIELPEGETYETGTIVSKSVRENPDIYDYKQLYYKQGDRVFKKNRSDNGYLYSQTDLDNITKAFLEEFIKNTTTVQVQALFIPYVNIGDSLYLSQTDLIYFVSGIQSNGINYTITLNYYPAV